MTTIHMETEKVRSGAKDLDAKGNQMLSSLRQTQSAASRLRFAWQGGEADDFNIDLNRLIKKIENHVMALETLSVRVSREVDEWVAADQSSANQIKADFQKPKTQVTQPRIIKDGKHHVDTEYILISGSEVQAYEGYLEGELTFKDAREFINKDPFEKKYVKSSISFYKQEEAGKLAWLDGQNATKFGDFTGSIGSIEGSRGAEVNYKDGAFRADANAELGLYAAKGTYSASVAGVSVAAAGFLGAEVQGKTGLAFDPSKGEVGGRAKVEAFAGAKVEGSVTKSASVAGVEASATAKGALSYGIGAKANVDVGFSEGHFRSEIELGATFGLGAEFGINIDLNVQQAVTSVIEAQKDAVDWLFR